MRSLACLNFEESPDNLEVHEPGDVEREQEGEDDLQYDEEATDLSENVEEEWLGHLLDVQVGKDLKCN